MENNRVPNNKASSVSASKKKSKNKHRYDYLWIASLIYLILGFFNIMFAWLGLACFFIPLAISAIAGNKAYCGKYCGRGQLFSLIGGRFSLSRKKMFRLFFVQSISGTVFSYFSWLCFSL